MNNTFLNYLLRNEPDVVLSKAGINIRKTINPLFRKIMMLFTSGNLKIVRKGNIPTDKKIIFAGTHGFHDDIIFSMKTADQHVYLLYGSLLDFFKSFHGIGLWINGIILVDRKNKQSRKSSIDKMVKAIELGTNIIMFPEGTWNKNEAIPVQKLYPGIYDVAEKTGAMVVPIATTLYGKNCYSIQGDAYDITDIDDKMSLEILSQQIKKIIKARDLFIYTNNNENYIKNFLNYLLNILSNNNLGKDVLKEIKDNYPIYFDEITEITNIINNQNIELLEKNSRIKIIDNLSTVLSTFILEINDIRNNAEIEEDSIYDSIFYRSINLLKIASKQKKITAVSHLRDKMCTLKWETYQKGNREEFHQNYWNEYIDSLINTTHGLYDHDIEDVAEYKDYEDISKDEVFSIFNNFNGIKGNAKVLKATLNKMSYTYFDK